MSDDFDLDEPAEVTWIPVDLMPPEELGGGPQRHFSTLRAAVSFVMQDLPPRDRRAASIMLRDGPIELDQIEKLYRALEND